MDLASIGARGGGHADGTTVPVGQVSFGVRSGGGGDGGNGALAEGGDIDEPSPGGQSCFGVRSGRALSGGQLFLGTETQELEGLGKPFMHGGLEEAKEERGVEEEGKDEGGAMLEGGDDEEEWPEYPWQPVIADVIKSSLESMSLEELNMRMTVSWDCL